MRNFAWVTRSRGFHCRTYCASNANWPRQVLSAIQPTGKIHLGNYIGAIKKWTELQNSEKNSAILGIADLHSITVPQDPQELHNNIFSTAATLLACGIDTNKSILFQQSEIPFHAQLCWILTSMTTMAKLSHLPQFKEKSKLFKEVPVGIFLYPVLQAADIMLYKATHIPVGEDQTQHIILVNHLIKLFNYRFGDTFPRVHPIIDPTVGRIKSLINPMKKMSKSDLNNKSMICLTDTPDEILMKCKKAITDFKSEVTFEVEARPGVSNLILIHSALTGKTPEKIVEESIGMNTGKYKIFLAEIIIEHLKPISEKINEYLNSREYLVNELKKGKVKANEIATNTLEEINCKIGFDLLNFKNNQFERIKTAL